MLILAWSVAVVVGWNLVWTYEARPGRVGTPPPAWPVDTRIGRGEERPTLLLFAHPQCPCTRATVGELAKIMAHCQGKVDARVMFFRPEGFPQDWEQTDLWRAAQAIPGVTVSADPAAAEARRFSVMTSGHALLYAPDGGLLFSGGITFARGHSGDNPGRAAVVDFLLTGKSDCRTAAVFGCSLVDDNRPLDE